MIRLDGVCVARGERRVLDAVSLAVGAADLLVIEGPRASGKSALLAVAAARQTPEQGGVWIASRQVGDLQRASLPLVRRNISYLPPVLALLENDSALENVMMALAARGLSVSESEQAARQALAVVGLDAQRPQPVAALSSGERQLVSVARALAGTPPAIVLDDPTATLGPTDSTRVLAAMIAARDAGAAVLAATSDVALVAALIEQGARRARLEAGHLSGGVPGISVIPRPRADEAAARLSRRQGVS